jgi:pimeloyl-ACP methyl ester carboxylesterase
MTSGFKRFSHRRKVFLRFRGVTDAGQSPPIALAPLVTLALMLAGCGYVRGGAAESDARVPAPQSPRDSGHAPVNGINMYYEVHGREDGIPLVLLHGGGSTIDVTFSRVLPVFAASRRVIAVEEQGHGRTTDRDAPVAFESSADDVAVLLRHLRVAEADILGFSNGASVALQLAIRYPQLVRKLVFASAMTKREGAHPQFWEFMKKADFSNMPQPLKDAFLRVNPDQQKLRTMHDKDAARTTPSDQSARQR